MFILQCKYYICFRTFLIGGAGSLLLDWYGWEMVFYATGLLAGLWALIVWHYLLKGKASIIIPGLMNTCFDPSLVGKFCLKWHMEQEIAHFLLQCCQCKISCVILHHLGQLLPKHLLSYKVSYRSFSRFRWLGLLKKRPVWYVQSAFVLLHLNMAFLHSCKSLTHTTCCLPGPLQCHGVCSHVS